LKKKQQDSNSNEFVAMIFEVFMLEKEGSWWIDSCATKHICKDRSLFKTFETVEDCVLFMGKSLTDVYFVPEIMKNLVSRGLLNKFGFKVVFESDRFVLTKGSAFVGKSYLFEEMFKLNLINKVKNFAYLIDSISLWHNRFGHVNTRRMHDMIVLNLIHKSVNNMFDKCKICMQTKITRKHFPKIDRSSILLQLVHSDVCDMHSNPTRVGKKYFVTFIDDFLISYVFKR